MSEATDLPSPASVSGDAKASPFGAARPIDTAAKEREIEEKRLAAIREKKEADDKAKEEKREAAKAAKAAEAEKQDGAEGERKIEILQRAEGQDSSRIEEAVENENANGTVIDDKALKPKEILRDVRPKPAETGAWRRPSGGPPPPRDDIPRGPRGRGRGRGGRGGRGDDRGGHDEGRSTRQNANGGSSPATPAQASSEQPETAALEEDGWSTVSKPKKNNRGGNQAARAIAS